MRIADLTSCYEKNADALTRFAATVVGSDDADDVVSDAIVGVLRSSPTHVDDMTAYLYRAVANAAKKHWRSLGRRERRERATAQTDLVDVAFADPAIAVSLMALSPQQRAVVIDIPVTAAAGTRRICTANAVENCCAELTITD